MNEDNGVKVDEKIVLSKFEGEPLPENEIERILIHNGEITHRMIIENGEIVHTEIVKEVE